MRPPSPTTSVSCTWPAPGAIGTSARSRQSLVATLSLVLLVAPPGGCTARAAEKSKTPTIRKLIERNERIARAAEKSFESAVLYKPADDPASVERELAPLIVYESDGTASTAHFATLLVDPDGRVIADESQPTVYTHRDRVSIAGKMHDRVGYYWWPNVAHLDRNTADAAMHGLRMTLDARGFPLVWELIGADADVLFVTESFEARAAEQVTGPYEGRMFHVEQSLEAAPDTTVARVIADGPMPLGPYVYLDAGEKPVSVICRCMPSQVKDFVGDHLFQIRPLSELGDWGQGAIRRLDARTPPLDRRLRWPKDE